MNKKFSNIPPYLFQNEEKERITKMHGSRLFCLVLANDRDGPSHGPEPAFTWWELEDHTYWPYWLRYTEVKSTYPEEVQTHDSTDSSGTRGHLVAWSCQRDL